MSRVLNEDELKALTDDLQEVLTKHNAEMGVTSTINLMKSEEFVVAPTATEEEGKELLKDVKDTNTKTKKGS